MQLLLTVVLFICDPNSLLVVVTTLILCIYLLHSPPLLVTCYQKYHRSFSKAAKKKVMTKVLVVSPGPEMQGLNELETVPCFVLPGKSDDVLKYCAKKLGNSFNYGLLKN